MPLDLFLNVTHWAFTQHNRTSLGCPVVWFTGIIFLNVAPWAFKVVKLFNLSSWKLHCWQFSQGFLFCIFTPFVLYLWMQPGSCCFCRVMHMGLVPLCFMAISVYINKSLQSFCLEVLVLSGCIYWSCKKEGIDMSCDRNQSLSGAFWLSLHKIIQFIFMGFISLEHLTWFDDTTISN